MHNRQSMRLPNYDYTLSGVYFVTICSYRFADVFGRIADGKMQLNELGRLVENEWQRTAAVRPSVEVDTYVVMPNHLHGLLWFSDGLAGPVENSSETIRANSLGPIIAQFKSIVTKRSRSIASAPRSPIWKRNYYDHIVRSERALERIRNYIIENLASWSEDRFYRD